MLKNLETYITSISTENFHMRGTFNMIEYFTGTPLETTMAQKIKELKKAGIL
jgi:hypothetical protein